MSANGDAPRAHVQEPPRVDIRNSADISAQWDHVEARVPPPRPRIVPGTYQARSASLKKYRAFGRSIAELGFDVYDGPVENGKVLARIPMFIGMAGSRGLSPNSKLARLFYLLNSGQTPMRWGGKVNLRLLQNKLWRVEVADAVLESGADDDESAPGKRKRRRLPVALRYSVISQVVERVA